ncbi:hypothetical protein ACHAQJ_008437 [Trichoderma viride]
MVQSRSASEPSSSSSSELPSLEELFRSQSIVSTGRQSSNGDGDGSQRGTSESNMSSSNGSNNNNEDVVVDDSPIPVLNSIFAAIFVPIPESNQLLAPLDLAPKSPEYHRAALNLVTHHEDLVRDNLQALFQRELLRISIDAETINPSFDYHAARASVQAEDEDALRRDCDAMIATMRQPDFPNRKYSLTNVPVPNMSSIPVTYTPVNSPREFAAKEVLKVAAAAIGDMTCFDRHVRSVRKAIKQQIHESESGRMDID